MKYDMTINDLQLAIAKLEQDNGWHNTADERMTFIAEELGEVAKWVRKARSKDLSPEEQVELSYEFADVLQHIIALANTFAINLEEGLRKKKHLED